MNNDDIHSSPQTPANTYPRPSSAAPSWQEFFNSDEPRTVKELAARLGCSEHTLKYNIRKTRKIPAVQESEKSAYKAKPSDIIEFLQAYPLIESIFGSKPSVDSVHRAFASPPVASDIQAATPAQIQTDRPAAPTGGQSVPPASLDDTALLPKAELSSASDEIHPIPVSAPESAIAGKPETSSPPAAIDSQAPSPSADIPVADVPQVERKRRTRRGKRRGHSVPTAATGMIRLEKQLASLSPAERTRFAGVFHELMGVILNP
jgi:hypothetical protein